jgi:Flp pilus assembly protein TadD
MTSPDDERWSAVEEAAELLHEERFREAMVALRRVLQADPNNEYAYSLLGVAFFEVGELEPSRDAYAACLKLAPAYVGARVARCHVLRMLGDVNGSIREGTVAVRQVPGDGDALHALGLAYNAAGDDAAARRHLEAFLATGPEFEVAVEARALLAAIAGEPAVQSDDDEGED